MVDYTSGQVDAASDWRSPQPMGVAGALRSLDARRPFPIVHTLTLLRTGWGNGAQILSRHKWSGRSRLQEATTEVGRFFSTESRMSRLFVELFQGFSVLGFPRDKSVRATSVDDGRCRGWARKLDVLDEDQ